MDQGSGVTSGITGAVNSVLVDRLILRRLDQMPPQQRRRTSVVVVLWLLVLTPAAGYGIWRWLARIAQSRAGNPGATDFALISGGAELGLPAGFLAIVLTAIPLSLLTERHKWKQWKQISNLLLIMVSLGTRF